MKKNLSLGETIKNYRIIKNRSQIQMASAINISQPAYAAYEKGTRVPKLEKRLEIAKALEVDPIAICGIELSETDEIRILNQLLVKYATNIESPSEDKITVTLPIDYLNLCEVYKNYKEAMTENELYGPNEENMKTALNESAKAELDYWLNTWPEYDYMYQGKKADTDPLNGGRLSLKETLKQKFLARFYSYQDSKS